MIAHQAVGMHLPASLLTRFGQGLEEVVPVHVVQEDVLAPVPTAQDMIDRAGILESEPARHGKGVAGRGRQVKPKKGIFHLTLPTSSRVYG